METTDITEQIDQVEAELKKILSRYKKEDILLFALDYHNQIFFTHLHPKKIEPPATLEDCRREILQSSIWYIPHYLVCLCLVNEKKGDLELNMSAKEDIIWRAQFISFLVFYLGNRKEFDIRFIDKKEHKFEIEVLKPKQRYSKFYLMMQRRALKIEEIDLLSQLKENHDRFNKFWKNYAKKVGFVPQSPFSFLIILVEHMIDSLANEYSAPQDQIQKYLGDCPIIIEKEKIEKYFERVGPGQKDKTFENTILSAEMAQKYLESFRYSERKDDRIYSLPLWDFPVVEINGLLFTSAKLLVDSVPELGERIKKLDAHFTQQELNVIRHDELVDLLKSLLKTSGFDILEFKCVMPEGEIDLLARKDGKYLHIECKAYALRWKYRFFRLEDNELDYHYPNFLQKNKIDKLKWDDKCQKINTFIRKKYKTEDACISHVVVTKDPAPIPDEHKYPEIIWFEDFAEWAKNWEKG